MPKVTLTPELGEKLKMERLNSKITAVELAKKLHISTGRLSNIENCKVKEVELGLFNNIINELIPSDKRKEYIETMLNDTVIRFSKKDIEKQDWFTIFDMQIRKVPINKELLDWLKITCEEISLPTKDIITIVNQNNIEDSDPAFLDRFNKCKPNQVFIEHTEKDEHIYIKFDLPLNLLDNILTSKITDISYIFMEGIINAFTQLPTCKYYKSHASTILYNLKFYNLKEKRKILSENSVLNVSVNDISALSDAENIYLSHKRNILRHFDKFNDLYPTKTNFRLEALNNNFDSDAGFALAFCTLPLDKLKDLDKDTKRALLIEIKDKINTLADNAKVKEEEIQDYDI